MEYLAGESAARLQAALRKKGQPLPPALACHIIAEACAGLHAAHEHKDAQGKPTGLVHRDVSPQNLFITYGGAVKVLDFGVARARGRITQTQVGFIKGKSEYMSPEQSLGQVMDRRTDIFALGICLWELLTGRSLFRRAGATPVAQLLSSEPLVAPGRMVEGLPAALDAVCLKALAAKQEERYADAAELRRDLLKAARELPLDGPADEALAKVMRELFESERAKKEALVLEGGPVAPDAPTPVEPSLQPKSKLPYAVAAVLALGLIAVAAIALRPAPAPPPPPPEPIAKQEPPPPAPVPSPEPAPAPEPSKHVKVEVQTVPAGAEVRINQRVMGRTPLELQLDRDTKPLKLSVRRPGSQPVEQLLVPDRDQRVMLQLAKHRTTRSGADPLQQKW
jgi:eukaryotic-like serine/threonine-protein kinase